MSPHALEPADPPAPSAAVLPPVVAPGTPWRAALRRYAVEPAWQLALAHAWLVLVGPVLVVLPRGAAVVLGGGLALATVGVLLVAAVRDLLDLRGWGVLSGAPAIVRMVRHLVTLGPWGYLGVRGRRTGDWAPFLASTAAWCLAAVTTGFTLFLTG